MSLLIALLPCLAQDDRSPAELYGRLPKLTHVPLDGAVRIYAEGRVLEIARSPDGRRFVSVDAQGHVKFWTPDGTPVPGSLSLKFPLGALAFAPDGSIAFAGGDDPNPDFDVRRVTSDGVVRLGGPRSRVDALAFCPRGERLASGEKDGTIRIWTLASPGVAAEIPGQGKETRALVFADAGRLWSAGDDGSARLWDAASRSELGRLNHGGDVWALALSPDGRRLVTGGAGGVLRIWDTLSGRKITAFADDAYLITDLAFRPDGRAMAVTFHDGQVRILYLDSGHRRESFTNCYLSAVAYAADGRRLWLGGSDGLKLWDPGTDPAADPPAPPEDPGALWDALADLDPLPALRAARGLATAEGVAFLKERLAPLKAEDLPRLVRKLEEEDVEARAEAMRTLERYGPAAEEALRGHPGADAREVLRSLARTWASSPEVLRSRRAIEALERAATPEARAILETLSGGAAAAPETRDAREALRRISN